MLIGCPLHAEEHNLLFFYRYICQGLGCTFWRPDTPWNVVSHRGKFAYKHSGIESSVFGNKVLSNTSSEQEGSGGLRQCHSSVLSQQARGTHSLEMCLMVSHLMAFCNPRAILLRVRHIQDCLYVIADSLSCRDKIIQTEWSLHPKIFQMICQILHRPMVDMFATKMNKKLPLYVSPVADPNAMAVDALNISWEALDGYAYCSIALIPKLIQKMRTYTCQMIVVAPGWPGMSCFGPDRSLHKTSTTNPGWVNDTVIVAKETKRLFEHIWRRDKSTFNRSRYMQKVHQYNRICMQAKSQFLKVKIQDNHNNPQKLWRVLGDVLHRLPVKILPSIKHPQLLADRCMEFFTEKN